MAAPYGPPVQQHGPITHQPQPRGYPPPESGAGTIPCTGNRQWMPMNTGGPIAGCPPGLEYLTMIDRILVEQLIEPLEVLTGIETCNQYVLMNSFGHQIYYALESSDFYSRQMCGPRREFTIHIVDNFGAEVMRVMRPFKCCAGCFCSCCEPCQNEIRVEAPPGVPIAYATETPGFCGTYFAVQDLKGTQMLTVDGPSCCGCCLMNRTFPVHMEGEKVGEITKLWSGLAKEMYTDADNFTISFPLSLDVNLKAALLGVLFLIDFMAFENTG